MKSHRSSLSVSLFSLFRVDLMKWRSASCHPYIVIQFLLSSLQKSSVYFGISIFMQLLLPSLNKSRIVYSML